MVEKQVTTSDHTAVLVCTRRSRSNCAEETAVSEWKVEASSNKKASVEPDACPSYYAGGSAAIDRGRPCEREQVAG